MVSGFGSFFNQEFNIPVIYGVILILILSIITFNKNINGIIRINACLIPFLIVLIIFLGFKINILKFNNNFVLYNPSWFIKSILYASYNLIILIPIIINLSDFITSKKDIYFITIFSVSILIIMSLIIFLILCINMPNISKIDIPIIFIANSFGKFYKYLYGFIILIAIYTSAISAGYSFIKNISKNKKQYNFYTFFLCVLSIISSNFGFSNLLNLLYPILGYLGFFQIGLLFYSIFVD